MKQIILLFCLITTFTSVQAQDSDYAAIEQAVSYYLDGGTQNDFATLEKAFHTDARMSFIADDSYREVNAIQFFKERMKPGPPQDRTTHIVSIEKNGHCAFAKLEIQYPTFSFHDYMTLLKIDGQWKIVNKSFYREMK